MSVTRRMAVALAGAGAGALLARPLLAQQSAWPDKPITLVVPFLPGGSTDIAARLLAEGMSPLLGAQGRVIVENRAGAGGSVGAEAVKQRAPDGYTLLLATASSHGSNPAALPQTTRYDPVEDFSSIAIVGGGPLVVVVPGNSREKTFAELLAFIRENPGRASWATSGAGGIGHLTGEYMKVAAGGLIAEHVPYRGGSAVMEALAKGEVNYSLEVLASAAPHLRDGYSRGLAVTSIARHPLFPEIPTLDESGLKGFEVTTWNVLLGPKGLPAPVVERLNTAANKVLNDPAYRAKLATAGVDADGASTPASTRAFLTAEVAKFRDIVTKANLKLGG
ncbi:tripartite tricarboxylate transporter substrate binding protein [Acetobacteraceae bacterium H6797]|nr:tripartite tricarboxylate transporter substrate binding protein [Acetobacteraceae bacterium H6797]